MALSAIGRLLAVSDFCLADYYVALCMFPSVARMAMQVHGCQACSSGVERLFSKACHIHSSQQNGLLEDRMADLLFSSNTY